VAVVPSAGAAVPSAGAVPVGRGRRVGAATMSRGTRPYRLIIARLMAILWLGSSPAATSSTAPLKPGWREVKDSIQTPFSTPPMSFLRMVSVCWRTRASSPSTSDQKKRCPIHSAIGSIRS